MTAQDNISPKASINCVRVIREWDVARVSVESVPFVRARSDWRVHTMLIAHLSACVWNVIAKRLACEVL